MDKSKEALDLFGQLLVGMMKDHAITSLNNILTEKYDSKDLGGLQSEVSSLKNEIKDIIRDCAIYAISSGIHGFLLKFSEIHDNPEFDQSTILFDGVDIIYASDGIESEYMLSTGWERRFSEYPTSEQVQIKYLRKHNMEVSAYLLEQE